jgi:hypothetical protein
MYNICKEVYAENKLKVFALIFSYCNKVMQNIIKKDVDYDANIQDSPIKLLEKIKKMMYDPNCVEYEYVMVTETLKHI